MRKDITGVRTELAEPLPLVSADPLELQLVLTNLIRNADQAGGPVTVITTARDGAVVCAVEDCGPGYTVDPKRLFEPFYTTKEEG
jgi:signal transduction histidine kinase